MLKEFEYTGEAMGTEYSIAIVSGSKELSDKMYDIAINDIAEYEARFSRFLPTSELSILNKNKKMTVSKTFFDVSIKAYELFSLTRGIFNPLVSISRFGYNKNFLDMEKDQNDTEDDSIYNIDFSSVVFEDKLFKIKLNEGQNLDYGGFLKGYLAELIAKKIKNYSSMIHGVIVNLGGDIYTEGSDQDGNKFAFSIYNPVTKKEDVKVVLYNEALATSGVYKRSWFNFDKKMHHILDISGKSNPENDIVSASVVYKDGSMAEAFTKVFMSMDSTEALKLLKKDDVKFIVIKNTGEIINNFN